MTSIPITVGLALLWLAMVAYLPLQRSRLIADYRHFEQHLIKP